MSPPVATETVVLDLRRKHRLLTAAKRYSVPNASPPTPDGLTLLFVHSTHTCKEYWEPTIEDYLDFASARGYHGVHEIWAVDSPYHGDTALLNWNAPERPYCTSSSLISLSEIPLYLSTNLIRGKYDAHSAATAGPFEDWEHWLRAVLDHNSLCSRRIVLIGHSMGAAVLYAHLLHCFLRTQNQLAPLQPSRHHPRSSPY